MLIVLLGMTLIATLLLGRAHERRHAIERRRRYDLERRQNNLEWTIRHLERERDELRAALAADPYRWK